LVLDVSDRFVLRESGRQETIGGGRVLDPAPPRRAGSAEGRLARRASAARHELPAILAGERGAVHTSEALVLTGSDAGIPEAGDWLLRDGLLARVGSALVEHVSSYHLAHPLEEGEPLAAARRALADHLRAEMGPPDPRLIDPILDRLVDDGLLARTTTAVALPSHEGPGPELDPVMRRVVEAISDEPAQPPTIKELAERGIGRDAVDAATRAGHVVRVTPDLVFLPTVIERAEAIVADARETGITVSAFREALGTSRKFAVPLLGWFDQRGITRREGDLRYPRSS
ncbi:MAG TPA: SelB C-terminal domain-containing protein, partial [Actinomycetota bacterium]|nr:SelB C-terminal domain-containing protein [Actinomycetota bacterium]